VPPRVAELPLTLKLVVDCSGSMAGDSIDAARRALHRILAGLAPADRFSYSRFGSNVHHDIAALTSADTAAIRGAADCIARTDADLGGTAMRRALESVFALGEGGEAADVLIITDGEVFGVDALVASAQRSRQRVFAVGIGSAPAEGVLRQLADATGGACEFIAPDEDAEAGILRMFSRLRSPRIERAEITWPTTPKWVTAVPQGLFGGETIHVFAGFDALPAGVVALDLVPSGEGKALTALAIVPGHATENATLPRMAAARRAESAGTAEMLALALRYSLLTELTNFIVVHARADAEKAHGLPELRTVAQMLAAGWGGLGSVHGNNAGSRSALDLPCLMVESVAPPDMFRTDGFEEMDFERPDPARVESTAVFATAAAPLDTILRGLDRRCAGRQRGQLPEALAELASLGVGGETLVQLNGLIAQGHDEKVVVRAFLEALAAWGSESGVSRQLLRALQHAFASPDEHREVRERVAAIIGTPMVQA
jgi:Ca-activated chloride channel family protein